MDGHSFSLYLYETPGRTLNIITLPWSSIPSCVFLVTSSESLFPLEGPHALENRFGISLLVGKPSLPVHLSPLSDETVILVVHVSDPNVYLERYTFVNSQSQTDFVSQTDDVCMYI